MGAYIYFKSKIYYIQDFLVPISTDIFYMCFLKELSRTDRTDHSLFHPWPEGKRRVSYQAGSQAELLGAVRLRKSLTGFSGHIISFGCR